MRLDKYLFLKGLSDSRQKAQELISGGYVKKNGFIVTKTSTEVTDLDTVEITGKPYPYVSRGGLKLEAAKKEFKIDFTDKIACDLGASTGGFTDVMLRSGIKKVFAVDCGHDQLHPSISANERVVNLEGTNVRDIDDNFLGVKCDIVVSDLSFISQTLIYSSVTKILSDGGLFISLIKPQFEAGKENIGKNGIVKDKKIHVNVIVNLLKEASKYNLFCDGLIKSPIKGGDGNIEYLAKLNFNPESKTVYYIDKNYIQNVVDKS
jgi:23S rRNA (cytidine1920-2'-O)/16S rRNA (cytidine1409-2'-O)-methyltransferase